MAYKIVYYGNGETSGEVPVDSNEYEIGQIAKVLDPGTLQHNIYKFKCWQDMETFSTYTPGANLTIYKPVEGTEIKLQVVWTLDEKYKLDYSGEQLDYAVEKMLGLGVDPQDLNKLEGLDITASTLNQLKNLNSNITAEQFNTLLNIKTKDSSGNPVTIQNQFDSKVNISTLSNDGVGVGSKIQPIYFDKDGKPQLASNNLNDTYHIKVEKANQAIYDGSGLEISKYYARKSAQGRVESTLLGSKWSNGRYSFEDIYPHELYAITVELSGKVTRDQYKLWCKAGLVGSSSENILTAVNKPNILKDYDIPIILSVTYIGD